MAALQVPHPMGGWTFHADPIVHFSPELLYALADILVRWPGDDGCTIHASDGVAAYSLDPAGKHAIRKGTLVYLDVTAEAHA